MGRSGGWADRDGGWDFFDAVDGGAELDEDGVGGVGGVGGIYFAKFDCRADGKLAIGGVVWGGECEIVVGTRVGCCWDENDALLRLAHPTLELGLGFGFPL